MSIDEEDSHLVESPVVVLEGLLRFHPQPVDLHQRLDQLTDLGCLPEKKHGKCKLLKLLWLNGAHRVSQDIIHNIIGDSFD